MQKLIKKLSGGTGLFILLALIAVLIMGSTAVIPRKSDLNSTAEKLSGESSKQIQGTKVSSGALLRANVIGK
jgi:hypothetical protein